MFLKIIRISYLKHNRKQLYDFFFFHRWFDEDQTDLPDATYTSDSESDSDIEEPHVNTRKKIIEEGTWSFNYDEKLYSSGIAVQNIPGTDLTVLQWLFMNFHYFTGHPSISKAAFSDNLRLQARVHKSVTSLPASYHEAKQLIKPYLVEKIVFDVCINDCIVYRNSSKYHYAELDQCPVCNEGRYVQRPSAMIENKVQISRRTFTYIPIGPRLARIYGDENLSKIVFSHPGSKNEILSKNNYMEDIHDAPVWKELYSDSGLFKGDNRGISFALELDGVNPFHNIGVIYSMTPIMLTMLNLPRHIRNTFGNILLVGIIKGKKTKGEISIDPYVEILVDELMFLTACKAYSVYDKAPVDIKLKLLLYVLDYPGLSKLFHQQGSGGISGCHWCHQRGVYCSHLHKTVYLGNRAYLEMSDVLRKDTTGFVDKQVDNSKKPKPRTAESEKDYREAFEKAKNKSQANFIASSTGCKGTYPLMSLLDHDRTSECCPDACHTVKDVTQNIVAFISGKSSNNTNINAAEKNYGRFLEFIDSENTDNIYKSKASSVSKPKKRKTASLKKGHGDSVQDSGERLPMQQSQKQFPYQLSPTEIKAADERACNVQVPLGFGFNPSPFFSKPTRMKSHDWKQVASQGILKYCLRGMLGENQRNTLFLLLDSIQEICSEIQRLDDLDEIEVRLNRALALLERDYPVVLQNITTHILHHVIDGIRKFGPIYGTWMFAFERFNSWICKRALNMSRPENTAIETYIIFEWCQFMLLSGKSGTCTNSTSDQNELDCTTEFEGVNDIEAVEFAVKKASKLSVGKRKLDSIHKQCGYNGAHVCSSCSLKKVYQTVSVKHPIHQRIVKYSCAEGERSSAKTVSSYVYFKCEKGSENVKLACGKYISFGHIKYFITHNSVDKFDRLASITVFEDVNYDNESGLWFVMSRSAARVKIIHLSLLSAPLVHAKDGETIWFCNVKVLKKSL